jgi:flagellar basal-body rod protein FlgG
MIKELYTAAMGMMSQQTRLEVISNNIANASTVGFKRDSVFERNLIDSKANLYNIVGSAEQNDPPIGSYIDFNKGSYDQTGNDFDIAIDGDGFFLLNDEQGKEFLTRAGNFKINQEGDVISANGKYLMANGGRINVFGTMQGDTFNSDTRKAEVRIDNSGEIFINNVSQGNLDIVDTNSYAVLEKVSSSDFILTEDNQYQKLTNDRISIRQGWLENSNVNVIDEMVEMINLQRQFEAGSKVITTNENTLEQSIGLGKYY